MSRQIKLKAQVGQTIRFPGQCVYDLSPAVGFMTVRHRVGRRTRLIDVPVCQPCQAELRRLSAAEQRQQWLGLLAAAIGGLVAASVTWLALPLLLTWLKGVIAAGIGCAVGAAILTWFRNRLSRAARPEKKAIRDALKITHFSWRAVTFEIANDAYADRFASLNKNQLMDTL
ncbi:MAG: hypothetical protein Fur0021_14910 [Candidatus Promineifilaceae bacterium]